MKNLWQRILCIGLIFIVLAPTVVAEEIAPYSDEVFNILTASLSSTKTVTFNCVAGSVQGSIKMTNCWLQQKNGTSWTKVRALEVPTVEAKNSLAYGAYMDYSNEIGSGTFRIGYTMNADGHTVTRYSNERTFN